MRRRTITALILAVIGFPAILIGGFFYYLLMGTFIIGASWEYVQLFRAAKYQPQMHITVGGVALIALARAFPALHDYALPVFEAAILIALAYHLYDYERGRDQAALDFSVTVTALTYIGWIGSYLFDLRNLPDGGWWLMLVMMSLWLSDSGAYSIGVAYGASSLADRQEPRACVFSPLRHASQA